MLYLATLGVKPRRWRAGSAASDRTPPERGSGPWSRTPMSDNLGSTSMHALKFAISTAWIVFWIYWLASAIGVKEGTASGRRLPLTGLSVLSVVLLLRVFRGGGLEVHSPALGALGAVVFASGIALAIWARLHLGRNWGMPMSQKAEPELVTSGPYRYVRHPIYSGLLAALLGTALATNLAGVIVVAVLGGYFYYSASVEEKNLIATFPTAYPAYRGRTKMLVPFLL
jgi:protein-S-isoprenylcysteine O-methyltransferase Ste14